MHIPEYKGSVRQWGLDMLREMIYCDPVSRSYYEIYAGLDGRPRVKDLDREISDKIKSIIVNEGFTNEEKRIMNRVSDQEYSRLLSTWQASRRNS